MARFHICAVADLQDRAQILRVSAVGTKAEALASLSAVCDVDCSIEDSSVLLLAKETVRAVDVSGTASEQSTPVRLRFAPAHSSPSRSDIVVPFGNGSVFSADGMVFKITTAGRFAPLTTERSWKCREYYTRIIPPRRTGTLEGQSRQRPTRVPSDLHASRTGEDRPFLSRRGGRRRLRQDMGCRVSLTTLMTPDWGLTLVQ